MEKNHFVNAIKQLRETASKRKFDQTFDIVINLRQLDLKKEDNKISIFVNLPHNKGKKVSVGALVDKELSTKAKASCDVVLVKEEFAEYDKKKTKVLAKKVDFFIAQATIMPQVAMAFGKVLGPLGKMPNPKAGCVVPPTADLKPLVERLQKIAKLETKNELTIKTAVGTEKMKDEDIADNLNLVYTSILNALPQGKENIKNVLVKLTMSKPIEVKEK
ncbi:MAG: 50S ribosomal protein L1 [Candidatus Nanoarchaeia archaeon]|nr:50S ribosomal protein L1 [Candidatus Nanoarchaeia archaeon]